MEKKYPIRYVARAVMVDGKPVAYFPSKVYVFEERKKYNSDGSVEEKCKIDFISRIYNEKYEIENGLTYQPYYKRKVFSKLSDCEIRIKFLHMHIIDEAIKDLSQEEIKEVKRKYKKYFKYAKEIGEYFRVKDINCEINV